MIETMRSILALPQGYRLFFRILGAPERSLILVREYIGRIYIQVRKRPTVIIEKALNIDEQ